MAYAMLNPKLFYEITPSVVKLTRKRDIGRRTVYLPLEIVQRTGRIDKDLRLADGEETPLFELDRWVGTTRGFKGKVYVCYIKRDLDGKRIL